MNKQTLLPLKSDLYRTITANDNLYYGLWANTDIEATFLSAHFPSLRNSPGSKPFNPQKQLVMEAQRQCFKKIRSIDNWAKKIYQAAENDYDFLLIQNQKYLAWHYENCSDDQYDTWCMTHWGTPIGYRVSKKRQFLFYQR